MAVQQNRVTRSKRGMRRSHDMIISIDNLSVDQSSREQHRRHHITIDGYYRGKKLTLKAVNIKK